MFGFVGSKLIQFLELKIVKFIKIGVLLPRNNQIGDIRYKNQIVLDKKARTVILLAAEHRDDVNPNHCTMMSMSKVKMYWIVWMITI